MSHQECHDKTILNVSTFTKDKINREYSIVKRKLLYELKNALFDIIQINEILNYYSNAEK